MAGHTKLTLAILFLVLCLPSASFTYTGSSPLIRSYGGPHWKENRFKYNSDFKVTTDFQKSWDLNNDGWLSGKERKLMESSPNKWGPSEWPPKKISR